MRTITPDPAYEKKTLAGVIDQGGNRLRVFRQSSMEHDHLSCEVYGLERSTWRLRRKEKDKFFPPDGFVGEPVHIDGVPVWCLERMTQEQEEAVRTILRLSPA